MRTAVLVVAAGRGQRFGGGLPKQYRDLAGRPVLAHSLGRFAAHPDVHLVQAVIHPDDLPLYEHAAGDLHLLPPVYGGATRQESVRLGLAALAAQPQPPDVVLIHDGARPCVSAGVVSRVVMHLQTQADTGNPVGVIPAMAMADTVKRAERGICTGTVDRQHLWRAQTPQGFMFSAIAKAHEHSKGQELTDDAAVLEAIGGKVFLVAGDENNIKVTTSNDLNRLNGLLQHMESRTGQGFDVHAFTEGDNVILCGAKIAHTQKLAGHSDADVGLHALTDAILGAIGAGDIGHHFPPSDSTWRGAASDQFLAHAATLVAGLGGRIVHVDVTLICEAPKVGPHRAAMRQNVADILDLDVGRVSIKATTTEKLGFTGRKEGIAAMATATVELPSLD